MVKIKPLATGVIAIVSLGGLALSFGVNAAPISQGSGQITFIGSIIDAPCSIAMESSNQEVDLGQVSVAELKNGQKSVPRDFPIKLENCDDAAKKVSVTFKSLGVADNAERLPITGSASGASVVIAYANTPIKLGVPNNMGKISAGTNMLRFNAYMQGDAVPGAGEGGKPTPAVIVPGNFRANATFELAYQ